MLSRRIPASFAPSEWSTRLEACRRAGPLLDLTESNPTAVGLGGAGPAELAALADPLGARYAPDAAGLPVARAAVAAMLGGRGAAPDPADVVLTAGTSESYAHLFAVLCDPGDVVLVPRPGYPLVEPLAAVMGVRVEPWRIAWDGRWHLDDDSLDAALEAAGGRARALVTVEPNHPTGSCLDPAERTRLERCCASAGLTLIADEVFGGVPRPERREPLPTWLGSRAVPTAVLGGLSKSAGMPQLKLGWIALAGPTEARARLREGLEWVSDLFLTVATPVQLAAPALLAARGRFEAALRVRLAANLARLATLTARRPEARVLDADGGWVAIVRLPERHDAEGWALALLEHGVAVHPGDLYDLEIPACVVVSLLPEPGVFAAACTRLETLLAG